MERDISDEINLDKELEVCLLLSSESGVVYGSALPQMESVPKF